MIAVLASWLARLKQWAHAVARDVTALALARHDPRVPWYAKALAVCVVAYALSPIDLIPDFIPVLGYADDLIILPLGILLAVRMVPRAVMDEHRAGAAVLMQRPPSGAAAAVIVAIWVGLSVAAGALAWGWMAAN